MRIVILGDFHLTPSHPEIADHAMEDINSIHPDLVVPLGDFGSGGKIGSPEGLKESWNHLGKLDAPLRPILGNHDLQQETRGQRPHHSMAAQLLKMSPNALGTGFMEFEKFRFLFISTDPQPADSCWQVQECYVASAQFQQVVQGIQERPGIPIIVFSHAPPIGCGLRTVPSVHLRSTNACLDQNHDPYRWENLYRTHKEIVLWFSAHYHLGHDHPDSMTRIYGTHFFQTQIHGLQTRDETRQSRILDLEKNSITVSTLDHIARQSTQKSRWHFGSSLSGLMEAKATTLASSEQPKLSITLSSAPLTGCVHALSDDRILIGTDDGLLWEAELSTRSVLGTWHIGPPLTGVAVTAERVWRAWNNRIISQKRDTLSRFIRISKTTYFPGRHYEIEEEVAALVSGKNTVFAVGTRYLWEYSLKEDRFIRIDSLPAAPALRKAAFWKDTFVFGAENGELWRRNDSSDWELLAENSLSWAADATHLAFTEETKLIIYKEDGRTKYFAPFTLDATDLLVPLPANNWLISTNSGLWELRSGEFFHRQAAQSQLFSAIYPLPNRSGHIGINHQNQLVLL